MTQSTRIPIQKELSSIIEKLTTEETIVSQLLRPDGSNGVEWIDNGEIPLGVELIGEFESQVTQDPTGVGIANAINITFGAGGSTSGSEFNLDSSGVLTCNSSTTQYIFNVVIRIARAGAGGVSELMARMMYAPDGVNYVQVGSTFGARVDDADTVWAERFNLNFKPLVGSKIYMELARNNGSANSGGLGTFQPTGDLAVWNQINTASLRISKSIIQ